MERHAAQLVRQILVTGAGSGCWSYHIHVRLYGMCYAAGVCEELLGTCHGKATVSEVLRGCWRPAVRQGRAARRRAVC